MRALVVLVALLSGCALLPPGPTDLAINSRNVQLGTGDTVVEAFGVARSAKVSFAVRETQGTAESCVVASDNSRAWIGGARQDAWTCAKGNATRQVVLERGAYFLGLRCDAGPCVFAFDLTVLPLT